DRRLLPLGTAAGQTIDQGRAGLSENACCSVPCRFERNRLAIDLSDRGFLPALSEKPGFGQPASAIGLDDSSPIQRDAQVVADTAADRAGHILDQFHEALDSSSRDVHCSSASSYRLRADLSQLPPRRPTSKTASERAKPMSSKSGMLSPTWRQAGRSTCQ